MSCHECSDRGVSLDERAPGIYDPTVTTLGDLVGEWSHRYGREIILVPATGAWRDEVREAAKAVTRLVVVVVENNARYDNLEIAPFLWGIGRVREHALFDFPCEAIELAPARLDYRVQLAEVCMRQGEVGETRRLLTELAAVKGDEATAARARAVLAALARRERMNDRP